MASTKNQLNFYNEQPGRQEEEQLTIYQRWFELNAPERDGWFGDRFDVTLEPDMLARDVDCLAIEHREFYQHEHGDETTTKQWREMLVSWVAHRRETEEVLEEQS